MTVFETLLEVQASDTAADQLRHRRANLPERAALVALATRTAEVRSRLDDARSRRSEVLGRQSGIETAVAAAGQRIKEIEGRLYSGQVSATKDILAMTAEVDSLKARRASLEDDLLAAMEEEEPLAAEVAAMEAQIAALAAEAAQVEATLARGEALIDAELTEVLAVRRGHAASVPDELLATYEQLRSRLGGEGAARLSGRSCTGCHLTLPAQELERIKRQPPDTLVLCEQCGRILVH